MGLDAALHEQVARRATVAPGGAAALQPDALTVGHAGGDAHLHLARPPLDTGPPAVRARVVDDHALAVARGARCGEREEALVVVDDAAPAARRAHVRRRPGLGARAVAHRARRFRRELQRRGDAVDGVGERQSQRRHEVLAPPRPDAPTGGAGAAARPAAEQVAEDVAQAVAGVERERAGSRARRDRRRTARPWGPACGPRRTPCAWPRRRRRRRPTEISLKRSSADGSPGLASGWFWRASFRYAFVMSFGEAPSGTPERLVVVLLEPLPLRGHQPFTFTMAGRSTRPFQR